ncbi:hypothetical protein ACFQH6_03560 [Halobacteriaceae archaeon GCM10025711]
MTDESENPLERLHVDADQINRELLADALEGVIGIDEDSGEAKHLAGYTDLDNIEKFVARLLYRVAAVDLGHFEDDEVGAESGAFGDVVGVDDSTIRQYVGKLDFVENESERGGYYIPGYSLEAAVEFLQQEDE